MKAIEILKEKNINKEYKDLETGFIYKVKMKENILYLVDRFGAEIDYMYPFSVISSKDFEEVAPTLEVSRELYMKVKRDKGKYEKYYICEEVEIIKIDNTLIKGQISQLSNCAIEIVVETDIEEECYQVVSFKDIKEIKRINSKSEYNLI